VTIFRRLKERKLGQWALAYVAAAWVVAQVVDVVAEPFQWPLVVQRGVYIVLVFGLPVVLILAWHHGERGHQRVSGLELLAIAGVLLAAGVSLALWAPADPLRRDALPGPQGSAPSLAVLPLDDRGSSEDESAFFAAGMHDDLLTQLSKVSGLRVISRTSVVQYADSDMSLREIGQDLGVDAILEGGVQRAGDRVRLNVQLSDARSEEHLWAETYDRELTVANVLTIQGEIARLVTDALQAALSPEEEARVARPTTDLVPAYDFYLRGRQVLEERTVEGNVEAIRLFKEAVAIDSSYANAWAGLANAYAYRNLRFGFSGEYLDSAETAATAALDLDAEQAYAYRARGLLQLGRGYLRQALEASLTAVRLDPNESGAVNNVGVLYHSLGQYDEAMRWIRRAVTLQPSALFLRTNIAGIYIHLGELELADSILTEIVRLDPEFDVSESQYMSLARAKHDLDGLVGAGQAWVELSPDDPTAHYSLATAFLDTRRLEEAEHHMRMAYELSPDANFFEEDQHLGTTVLGAALVGLGDLEAGQALLAGSVRRMEEELAEGADLPIFVWELGSAEAALGDVDAALAHLEEAAAAGWLDDRWPLIDPVLDPLRDEPRFVAMMAAMRDDIAGQRRRVAQEERAAGLR
jgi:TolB-like protein/tetratricopeptide (TPR) repeat protein